MGVQACQIRILYKILVRNKYFTASVQFCPGFLLNWDNLLGLLGLQPWVWERWGYKKGSTFFCPTVVGRQCSYYCCTDPVQAYYAKKRSMTFLCSLVKNKGIGCRTYAPNIIFHSKIIFCSVFWENMHFLKVFMPYFTSKCLVLILLGIRPVQNIIMRTFRYAMRSYFIVVC